MQKRLLNDLSKQLLGGTIKKDSIIEIDIDEKNNFVFRNLIEEIVV